MTLGMSMLLSAAIAYYYNENDLWNILRASGMTIGIGALTWIFTSSRKKIELSVKDGFAIVTLGWVLMAAFSALPFHISGAIPNYVDAYFEAMSGLTTTGASILGHQSTNQIEALSHGLLFWRSFTHFIGGMGIIVFSIAVLPLLGMGGVQLFKAEVAGPVADKITPRVKQTAKYLWAIYVGIILLETVVLRIEGMNWFDAICHAFGTMATGGFSTKSASVGFFNSAVIEWTIIIFMIIAATNFSLHFQFLTEKSFVYWKDSEFKFYISAIGVFSVLIGIDISIHLYGWSFESLRHAMFATVSLVTTTGFGTEDFEMWPPLSKTMAFFLLFIGGSAGSTTGALKIIRTMLVLKYLSVEVKKLLHPRGVYPLIIGEKIIPDDVVKNTLGFYLFYLFIFGLVSILLATMGLDLTTALTASASALGNIGPGLGSIGPTENWGHFPAFAKWLSSFCMLLGRLEIFTVMVLFSRSYWKK